MHIISSQPRIDTCFGSRQRVSLMIAIRVPGDAVPCTARTKTIWTAGQVEKPFTVQDVIIVISSRPQTYHLFCLVRTFPVHENTMTAWHTDDSNIYSVLCSTLSR